MSQEKTNLFEIASRRKYRFDTIRGSLSIEQLWDAPLTSTDGYDLDTIARNINKRIKAMEEDSFVVQKTVANEDLTNKLDILKKMISTRLEEVEARTNATAKSAEKQKLLNLLAEKQDAELKDLSAEEIQAKIDAL